MFHVKRALSMGTDEMASIRSQLEENTKLTEQIARNTAGFMAFSDDLYAGTRLLCRCAKGISFMLSKPVWQPTLVIFLAGYWATHDGAMPEWLLKLVKALFG